MAVISDKIEAGSSARDAVAQVISENDRCIFNGNGYSDEWTVEAEARGLPNNRNTYEAWRGFDSDANKELFASMGVLKDHEMTARKDIALGEYTNTLMTEALCSINMTDTGFLPACAQDLQCYSGAAEALAGTRKEVYHKISAEVTDLKQLIHDFPADAEPTEQAGYMCEKVKPQMDKLRVVADEAERLCNSDLWPYPKYEQILFHHQSDAMKI